MRVLYSDNDQFYRSLNICRITEKFYITCEQLGSPWAACSRLSDSGPDYLGAWNRLLPGVWARRQSTRRVRWQDKFFFQFWPSILMIQDANSHTHPTPHPPPRFCASDLLRWFFVIRASRKSYDFESATVKKRNLSFIFITNRNVTTQWAVSSKLFSVFYLVNVNKRKQKNIKS